MRIFHEIEVFAAEFLIYRVADRTREMPLDTPSKSCYLIIMDPLELAIPDLDENDPSMGPAMKNIRPLQRRFVLALLLIGPVKGNYKRAAIIAGYKDTPGNAANVGFRLMHDPNVSEALMEEAIKAGRASAATLTHAILTDLALNSRKENIRMKAALALGDRFGLPAVSEQHVRVTKTNSPTDVMLAKIREMVRLNPEAIKSVPAPVRALLERPVDAEFTEITKDPDAELLGDV